MCSIHVLSALVTVSCTAHIVLAAPPSLRARQDQGSGETTEDPSMIKPTIWIPLAVIAALFVFGTLVACCGRRFRSGTLLSWATGAAQAAGAATGTTPSARELTADQLAGSARGNNTTTVAGNGAGSNRPRRPRRTRRTPSQISTHSLPAYMKEPGDQEIVIVRGADELEDEIPITVTMPPVDEHGSDTPRGSFDITRPSTMHTPHPLTANDVPLLHSNDLDAQHLSPDHLPLTTRASFDSTMSSTENSSQHHYTDDAPAYETVILNDPPTSTSPVSSPPGAASSPTHARTSTEQSGTGATRRRSMFASIFNPRNSRGPSAASPPPVPTAASPEPRSSTGHTREGSGPSIMSVPGSERDQRRSRILRHHPSHSGSGSMFSLLSRTRSGQNLNGVEGLTSPSMISLHSISSPLTHTLVKTEFTYPKGGPTPDQLKLISSRESLARFGKPYGMDAIAFAASASRAELEPPPGFDEIVGSSSAGPSSSPQQGRDTPSSDSPDEQVDDAHEASTSSPTDSREVTHVLPGVAESDSPVEVTSAIVLPSMATSHANAATAQPSSPSSSTSSDLAAETSHPPPGLSSQSTSSPEPSQPAPSTASTVATKSPATIIAPTSNAPPSAFKALSPTPTGGSFPARAASRASSYMSYATAEESLHSPSTPFDSQYDLNGRDDDDAYQSAAETPVDTAPPTPRISPRHMHESTDTTITPGQ
ncbi:hypothetical protein C8Q80DRAFT_1118046 [Daedaleopsis nitida]|nr:hypothetical protein C8Q80DRAFT_1118046 [Daedaleopsis nitida]